MPQVIPLIPSLMQAAGLIAGATATYATVGLIVASPVYGAGRPLSKPAKPEAPNELN